jgi:LmbE family N-acetylglucosaminyl deacetylase
MAASRHQADGLLVFDRGGITGHPDHDTATAVAVEAGVQLGLQTLAWALASAVAGTLRAETGAGFIGRGDDDLDFAVQVDRSRQLDAVRAHPSQAVPGSVLWRRLELSGSTEFLRWL